jgi:predicted DNA-binding protein YlxM (UPF0122 family)
MSRKVNNTYESLTDYHKQVMELYRQDLTYSEIGRRLNRERNAIHSVVTTLVRNGFLPHRDKSEAATKKIKAEIEGPKQTEVPKRGICNYPRCKHTDSHSFAKVPLCLHHHEVIMKETLKYYNAKGKGMTYFDRIEWLIIKPLSAWWCYDEKGKRLL